MLYHLDKDTELTDKHEPSTKRRRLWPRCCQQPPSCMPSAIIQPLVSTLSSRPWCNEMVHIWYRAHAKAIDEEVLWWTQLHITTVY
jgi:hypothetical protein